MSATVEVRAPSEQSEGTRSQVQRWLKAVGDNVAENEPLIEVETDKVTIEIPAPASGVLHEIMKQEQEEIAPGELLAVIQTAQLATAKIEVPAAEKKQTAPAPAPIPETSLLVAALAAYGDTLSAGRSSPAVRRLLEEHKVDSSEISGSGAGGRITVDDVLGYVANRGGATARDDQPNDPEVTAGTRVPHSATRKRIAQRMVESLLQTAPHVTTVFEADLSTVIAHRARHRAAFEERGAALTFTVYFLAACVDAIREVPEVNSRWTPDALHIHETIDIGVGTAVPGKGLFVPVVRNVQSLDLFGIASELSALVGRAREGKLTIADVRGGTFTISNHGVSGSLVATPIIINQPQSAILGVGKLEKRAVVISEGGEDRIVVRPRCYVTLTIDHRVMDGERANRFLAVLVKRLEGWE
jgi:2-oxoglutarate dehydrogenase E2 component (dihydrolipoamide succinyltransferase)